MTTVAANFESMAADTRVTCENGSHYPAAKIFRVGESLFGTAGHGDMCLVMVEWLRGTRNKSVLYKLWGDYDRDEISLLELNPRGLFLWTGWGCPEPILLKHFAIGSGQQAALKGLDKGESPHDAVKGASDYDIYTHAPIQVEMLVPAKRKNVKKGRR